MKTRFISPSLLLFLFATAPFSFAGAQVSPSAGMIRYPDISADRIVFVYADDLWTVNHDGGQASPLASPAGAERNPRFSPDGKTIAFMGNYEGVNDLYTIPAGGGTAKRMTWHPATEVLSDWHPNGKDLVYATNGFAGLGRQQQIFTISEAAPLPQQLPVPYGSNAAISDDGEWMAYTPYSRDTRTWKRYRGGMASDIWLFNLNNKSAKQITDFEGTDSLPMWKGDTVYYLSDAGRESRLNIWAYDTKTSERRQITKFEADDCKWPAIGPGKKGEGEIIFQNGTNLSLLNLKTNKVSNVNVTIPGDRPSLRNQKVDAAKFVTGYDSSPNAKRLVVAARGDLWTLPAEKGTPRNLTRTSGVAERDPSWSPDGRWIAYFSDATDEYELYVTQSDGKGSTRQLTKDGSAFRFSPIWSPDSKFITFSDKAGVLWLYSFDKDETKQIDVDWASEPVTVNWSHNSEWITYSVGSDDKAPTTAIWVYNVRSGEKLKLTSGYFPDSSPVFDRKGDHIFFISNRSFNNPEYEDLGTTFIYTQTEVLLAMPLRSDVKHPFKTESDEETWKNDKADEKKDGDKEETDKSGKEETDVDKSDAPKEQSDKKPADKKSGDKDAEENADDEKKDDEEKEDDSFKIEADGAEMRIFQIPVGAGSFGALGVNNKNHLIYGTRPARGSGRGSIMLFDLADDERKAKTVVEGTSRFGITPDGKKLLVVTGGSSAHLISAAVGQKLSKAVPTAGMTVSIVPREEWKQLFADAWRIERDYFYDPNMHGVDWKAIRKHYSAMLEDCVSRRDVGFVIGEMISEINVGHAYYREGDVEKAARDNVGLPGCRFEADKDRYKIAELFEGAVWDVDARNTLRTAGIKQGEYLLAINGLNLTTKESPYALLQGISDRVVTLTISEDSAVNDNDREVTITMPDGDTELRFRAWIEHNRKYTEERTDGQVGYIYVVNTGVPGQNDLVRQFVAQLNKKALIIDDRWNGGGQIPTRFIELLNRPVTNYWAKRDGRDWTWPPDAHHGPKCMLTNGLAGSGGDMFPALFRQAGLGKLVGMRTWGGLVGMSGNPALIDGGSITSPSFAYYEKDGTWGIEGHGVDPDIEVIDDPSKMADGSDPQLDAAIKLMLDEIKTKPYAKPARPAYPDRSKMGLRPEDK